MNKEVSIKHTNPLLTVEDMINFQLYPINSSQDSQELINDCRHQLTKDGFCVLKNFLSSNALEILQQESQLLAPHAYYAKRRCNAFKTDDDPSLPLDHPVRFFMDRTNAFVPTNIFAPDSLFKKIYNEPIFKNFLAACLKEKNIYEYDDPLAGLVLNILGDDTQHPWHYDQNDFSIVLMIQPAKSGGVFEYVKDVRTPENENYELVKEILHGECKEVTSLNLQPGDLQIFMGKNSLHRVTKVSGDTQRYTAIFAYTINEKVIGKAKDSQLLFGKVTSKYD
ncbi:HalD/BesD family halogenase [Calothrix rhizosoleniae]|uniref:HalD/BesD family halogenase n=1 Tax=Calothrix rhizosoleniae TaxID=888997 RepID=UPI000B497F54|nr:hypothetical protein [Calothrix rhizosoleniae]